MPFNLENFKNKPPIVIIRDEDINGLSFFKKSLERLFFSDVVIRNSAYEEKKVKLIIEISCNFNLLQGMSYLKAGIWGQLRKIQKQNFKTSDFYGLVKRLQHINGLPIEVEEFSLNFKDSSIIIGKLYKQSIPEQLDAILTQLSEHYFELTKGEEQIPFEIFIPVFEGESNHQSHKRRLLPEVIKEEYDATDYFKFWGLYFEDQDDELVYNLKSRKILIGELNMLSD